MCFIFLKNYNAVSRIWYLGALSRWTLESPSFRWATSDYSGGFFRIHQPQWRCGVVAWMKTRKSLQKHHHGCKWLFAALTIIWTASLMYMVLCVSCWCVREKELHTPKQIRKTSCWSLCYISFCKICVWVWSKFILRRPYSAAFNLIYIYSLYSNYYCRMNILTSIWPVFILITRKLMSLG